MAAGNQLLKALTHLLFPSVCFLCKEPCEHRFCVGCLPLLQKKSHTCLCCGEEGSHPECPFWMEPFVEARAAVEATLLTRAFISRFRKKERYLAKEIASWMVVAVIESGWEVDEITFVPSPPFRRWSRGFTPAEALAKEIASLLSLPLVDYLGRKGGEPSQEHFTLEERKRNVLNTLYAKRSPKGKRLLLVDDFQVSGRTLHMAGVLLKQKGASAIFSITFFRDHL